MLTSPSFSFALQPNAGLRLHNAPPPHPSISWLLLPFHHTFPRPHFWFPNRQFLRDGVVNPTTNPQPGEPGPIFITPGTGWPSYTPRHWVPIIVAFFDMLQGLFCNPGHHMGFTYSFGHFNFIILIEKLFVWRFN